MTGREVEIEVDAALETDNTNTPYDDVFRTMLNDCPSLIIPVVNAAFHEHYTGNERIEFRPNEHFINQQDGKEQKRITDTFFIIYSSVAKGYHIECESTEDGRVIIRIFEYDSQIALDGGVVEGNVLRVKFPRSALLLLRSKATTPDAMTITIELPDGRECSYDVPVIKVQEYTLDEIFQKGLYFLIPFYIFTHERRFKEYEKDEEKFRSLLDEYRTIKERLEELMMGGKMSEFVKCMVEDMSNKVLAHIARKHPKVRKGVKNIMGGRVLEYEAKTILRRGIKQGLEQGIEQGLEQGLKQGEWKGRLIMLFELFRKNLLSLKDASDSAQMTEGEFLAQMEALQGC